MTAYDEEEVFYIELAVHKHGMVNRMSYKS
jgi:hypothetical protein